jgi:tetratricopeptide (TPR) repeat protein
MGHAFISYVREDLERVMRLRRFLEAADIPVWFDTENLWPGQDWRLEVRRAIKSGTLAFLACFSIHSAARATTYQNEEMVLAVEQMRLRPPGAPWLIPVRFDDCPMPEFDLGAGRTLESVHRVDLFDGNWEEGGPRLVASIQRIFAGGAVNRDGFVAAAGTTAERRDVHVAGTTRPRDDIPEQLPADVQAFTGRALELAQLTSGLAGVAGQGATLVISAIGGAGGIGKTALALHWAHRNVERFPDGQLYVDLHGFDPTDPPMASEVALRHFLGALGVGPTAIPAEVDAQSGLYRSLISGKRMLVVLDNALSTAQVAPLLPGSATCTVLVTSRKHLGGLVAEQGATLLDLDVLEESDARELLGSLLGLGRVAAELDAVLKLLAACGGLPLALRILAARATFRPKFPLSELADEVHEAAGRLDALEAGEEGFDVRAVFSSSYEALDDGPAEVFRLLGLAPGPDISLEACASLVAQPVARTRVLLRELEAAYLVQQHLPGRYRMHDLIRLFAAERALVDSPHSREVALQRVVDFYLHTAYAGDRLIDPERPAQIDLGRPVPGCVPRTLTDPKVALAWFDAEQHCLLAAQRSAARQGWYARTWQLAWTLSSFLYLGGLLRDYVAVWRTGLAAADQLDDVGTRGLAHRLLGQACTFAFTASAEAVDNLSQALTFAEQTGDVPEQAHTHRALSWAWDKQGDSRQALTHARKALDLYEVVGNSVWKARALTMLGWLHAQHGDYGRANTYCTEALALVREHRHREGEADTVDCLGYVAQRAGEYTDAVEHYHQALELFRELGSTYDEANVLRRLGEVHLALGQGDEAREVWAQAFELYRDQHRSEEAERIRRRMLELPAAGSPAGVSSG